MALTRREVLGTVRGAGYKRFGLEVPRAVGRNYRTDLMSVKCSECGRVIRKSIVTLAKTGNPGECCGEIMEVVDEADR